MWQDCTSWPKRSWTDHGPGLLTYWRGCKLPDLPAGVLASIYEEGRNIEVRLITPKAAVKLSEPAHHFPSGQLLAQVMLVVG